MNDYLYHYGVLGMKWGIRKDRRSSERRKRKKYDLGEERVVITKRGGDNKTRSVKIKKQSSPSDNVREAAREAYKNRNKYTNSELNDILTRLDYEKRLIELSAPKKSKGQKWVEDVFSESAKKLAISAINKTGNAIIDKALADAGLKSEKDKKKEKNDDSGSSESKKSKKKKKDNDKSAFLYSDRRDW